MADNTTRLKVQIPATARLVLLKELARSEVPSLPKLPFDPSLLDPGRMLALFGPKVMLGHRRIVLTFQQNPGGTATISKSFKVEPIPVGTVDATAAITQLALSFLTSEDASVGTWTSQGGAVPEIIENPIEAPERPIAFQQVSARVEEVTESSVTISAHALLADARATPWAGLVEVEILFWGIAS